MVEQRLEQSQEAVQAAENGNRLLLKLWVGGMVLLLFLGWFNFSVNAQLTAAEQFAETFPITTDACLIPVE